MNTLDNLFREKLTDHALPPAQGMWERVESRLRPSDTVIHRHEESSSKKNRSIIWMRYAAAVALVGLVVVVATRQKEPVQRMAGKQEEVLPGKKAAPASSEQTNHQAAVTKKSTVAASRRDIRQDLQPVSETKDSEAVFTDNIELEKEVAQNDQEVVMPAVTSKPIVLVYTLAPVTGAASDELTAKEGTLKKMVDYASNVKNGDASPVGELRTMKEDIFALDFKKKTTSKKQ